MVTQMLKRLNKKEYDNLCSRVHDELIGNGNWNEIPELNKNILLVSNIPSQAAYAFEYFLKQDAGVVGSGVIIFNKAGREAWETFVKTYNIQPFNDDGETITLGGIDFNIYSDSSHKELYRLFYGWQHL